MNTVLSIVEWYTNHFSMNVTSFAQYGFVYGWLAAMSAVTAILTLLSVVFKREAGASSAALIGQHVLILGVPFIWGQAATLYSTASIPQMPVVGTPLIWELVFAGVPQLLATVPL